VRDITGACNVIDEVSDDLREMGFTEAYKGTYYHLIRRTDTASGADMCVDVFLPLGESES